MHNSEEIGTGPSAVLRKGGPSVAQLLLMSALLAQCVGILSALGLQYIGGMEPCEMCRTQRIPYYLAIPLTIMALIVITRGRAHAMGSTFLVCALLAMGAALFFWGSGLGIYQAGAQYGLWAGPQSCGNTTAPLAVAQASALLDALKDTRIVSCAQIDFSLFGVSLPALNALLSAAIAALLLSGAAALALQRRGRARQQVQPAQAQAQQAQAQQAQAIQETGSGDAQRTD